MDINAVCQSAYYQGVRVQCRQVGKETGADILPIRGGMTGSYYINNMQRVQISISPNKIKLAEHTSHSRKRLG
mgnify:CR=1 FL=1